MSESDRRPTPRRPVLSVSCGGAGQQAPGLPPADTLARLGKGVATTPAEAELYVRYLRVLALLCECAPYVDEPDYVDLIADVLADAQAHYPLEARNIGATWQIAQRADPGEPA